jgi:hypothetical protein
LGRSRRPVWTGTQIDCSAFLQRQPVWGACRIWALTSAAAQSFEQIQAFQILKGQSIAYDDLRLANYADPQEGYQGQLCEEVEIVLLNLFGWFCFRFRHRRGSPKAMKSWRLIAADNLTPTTGRTWRKISGVADNTRSVEKGYGGYVDSARHRVSGRRSLDGALALHRHLLAG